MAFHIPAGLGPELYPLSWLVGTWRGEGTIGYHDEIAHARVLQEVAFTHDGGPYLAYRSTTWLAVPRNAADAGSPAPADGSPSERGESGEAEPGSAFGLGPAAGPVARGDVWHTESGYWRVVPGQKGKHGGPKQDPPFEVESLVADPAGYVTIYAGQVDGARIDLATDLLARVPTAAELTAAKRLYGLVDSHLLWAWDIAAFGHPLDSYMATRLTRQGA